MTRKSERCANIRGGVVWLWRKIKILGIFSDMDYTKREKGKRNWIKSLVCSDSNGMAIFHLDFILFYFILSLINFFY